MSAPAHPPGAAEVADRGDGARPVRAGGTAGGRSQHGCAAPAGHPAGPAEQPAELADPGAALAAARALAPQLAARAERHDRDGVFPAQDFAELRAAGLLGLMVPRQRGGSGAGFADYVEVAMALGAGSGATALIFNMHASVTGALAGTPDDIVRALGVPESYFVLRDRMLERARAGALFAVAMSERGAGSRLSALTTEYQPTGAGYRIRGAKTFVSGAGHADYYLVAARAAVPADPGAGGTVSAAPPTAPPGTPQTAPPGAGQGTVPAENAPRVSYFLVPAGEGVTVRRSWDSLGMRATGSDDLLLDVTVDADCLLGGVEGLTLPLAQVMPQWLVASYAAVYVGVAQAAVDAAVSHLTDRGLRRLPAVRARVGRADARVAAARLAVLAAARRVDQAPGQVETNRWVWRAKLLAGETAMEVAGSMLEAAGTSATRRGNPLERIYRDARCGSLQPATSDVCADWLGLAALGLDPERDTEVARW